MSCTFSCEFRRLWPYFKVTGCLKGVTKWRWAIQTTAETGHLASLTNWLYVYHVLPQRRPNQSRDWRTEQTEWNVTFWKSFSTRIISLKRISSAPWLSRRGDIRDGSAAILFQSFLWEATVGRDVLSLTSSISSAVHDAPTLQGALPT